MRLLSLQLNAYGPFTDYTIDFTANGKGIQLVYGPNEAGKSATLRAITDLLYGIPDRTRDNFIHENSALRIGACIRHSDGSSLEFFRRKGRKNTLLDSNDKVIEEAVLEKYLSGITRELFETVYGINQSSLVEGGKQLLMGGGEIGRSLFSAGLGIATMNKLVEALASEAGMIFKPSAKNPRINQLTSRFREIKKACSEKSLPAKEWLLHDKALADARRQKREIEEKISTLTAERNRLDRFLNAIPKITKRARLTEEIATMGDVMVLPDDFSKERRTTQEVLIRAQIAQKRLKKDIEELKSEMNNITLADVLLTYQADIRELFQRSGSYTKANRDLPNLKARYYRMIEEAEALLKRLNPTLAIEHAESLRITDPALARIRQLGRNLEPLLKSQTDASRRKISLESRLTKVRQEIEHLPEEKNPEKLQESLERSRVQGDLGDLLSKVETDITRLDTQAGLDLKRLGLWEGTLEEAEQTPIPESETVERYASAFTESRSRIENLSQRIGEYRDTIESCARQIDAMQASGEIPTEEDLYRARKHRDEGWQLVKEALHHMPVPDERLKAFDHESADLVEAFEKSLKKADEISDRLRSESERVATLSHLMAQKKDYTDKLILIESELAKVQEEMKACEREWQELWNTLKIKALTPKEMKPWCEKYQKLLLLSDELRGKRAEGERLKGLIQHHISILKHCMTELGEETSPDATLENLILTCKSLLKRITQSNNQRERLKELMREIEIAIAECDNDITQTKLNIEAWHTAWGSAVKQIGLSEKALPEEADTVIDHIQELFERLDGAKELQGRIKAIQADNEKFSEKVSGLCCTVGAPFDKESPHRSIEHLNNQLTDALKDDSTLKEKEKRTKQCAAELRDQEKIIEEAQAKLDALCLLAQCSSHEELPGLEDRSQRLIETREKIKEIESELDRYTGGASIHQLCMEAEGLDIDCLPAEIDSLDSTIAQLQQQRSDIDQEIGREETALKAMDGGLDAAQLAEEAQEILSSIENEADRYASLRISSIILRKEIERYREENQGPILERASDIFRELTLGSFEKLISDFDDNDQQVIKGVRPAGEKIGVEGMSDGTCDQLYLALRLASIEQRLTVSEPMPLILDDIFVNFDDERTGATLRVLDYLSAKTQIILFTHHLHLSTLASKILDNEHCHTSNMTIV
ncbi:MAG: AAA family ATPase [bacterium]